MSREMNLGTSSITKGAFRLLSLEHWFVAHYE